MGLHCLTVILGYDVEAQSYFQKSVLEPLRPGQCFHTSYRKKQNILLLEKRSKSLSTLSGCFILFLSNKKNVSHTFLGIISTVNIFPPDSQKTPWS